jgi:hypothetical protein
MNQILYENRCRCNEEFSITKKRKSITRSEGKPLQYPNGLTNEATSKTFHIKYEKRLSPLAKVIFNSFQNKYIYYAIDDILYSFRANPVERENLLAILYSPVLSLQNNFSINFFDIWIREIYIEEISKVNKFLTKDSQASGQFSYITIKLLYKTRVPVKKQESLW